MRAATLMTISVSRRKMLREVGGWNFTYYGLTLSESNPNGCKLAAARAEP